MKNKLKYSIRNFCYLLSTQKFRLILLVLLVLSLYGNIFLTTKEMIRLSYFDGLVSIFTTDLYLLIFFFLFYLSTMYMIDLYCENLNLFIRFKTRKKFFKELLKNVWFNNTIFFFSEIFLVFFLYLFFSGFKIEICGIAPYWIPNLVYLIFVIIKLYIFMLLLSFINSILYFIFSQKILFFINVFNYGTMCFFEVMSLHSIDSILKMKWYVGSYLIQNNFSTFYNEIYFTALYLFFLFLVFYGLFHFTVAKAKKIVQ